MAMEQCFVCCWRMEGAALPPILAGARQEPSGGQKPGDLWLGGRWRVAGARAKNDPQMRARELEDLSKYNRYDMYREFS